MIQEMSRHYCSVHYLTFVLECTYVCNMYQYLITNACKSRPKVPPVILVLTPIHQQSCSMIRRVLYNIYNAYHLYAIAITNLEHPELAVKRSTQQ